MGHSYLELEKTTSQLFGIIKNWLTVICSPRKLGSSYLVLENTCSQLFGTRKSLSKLFIAR